MVLSDTVGYITLLGLTIVFTSFAFVIPDSLWRNLLKFVAGLFWMVMAVANFYFMGPNSFLAVMSLPYAVFGMLFIFMMFREWLNEKHQKPFLFDD
jgi:hypothetical protein